jgi:hypothetical protein
LPDIAAIGAVLSSLKTATDIAKLLRETDLSLEKAELKLKLAELIGALADAKIEVTEIQELLAKREQRIKSLEDAFQSKDSICRVRDAYYVINENGKPAGAPLCVRSWDVEHKKYQLQYEAKDRFVKVYPACKQRYEARMAQNIDPNATPTA